MEGLFPHSEVINMGCSGYGVDQEYLWLKREGLKFKPDYVVVLVDFHSDIFDTANSVASDYQKPLFLINGDLLMLTNVPVPLPTPGQTFNRWLKLHSIVWNSLFNRKIGHESFENYLAGGFDRLTFSKMPKLQKSELPGEAMICILLGQTQRLSLENQARFLAVLSPLILPAKEEIYNEKGEEALKKCLTVNQIPFLDLKPAFQNYLNANRGKYVTFADDVHWNATGHRLVAAALYAYFANQKKEALPN